MLESTLWVEALRILLPYPGCREALVMQARPLTSDILENQGWVNKLKKYAVTSCLTIEIEFGVLMWGPEDRNF